MKIKRLNLFQSCLICLFFITFIQAHNASDETSNVNEGEEEVGQQDNVILGFGLVLFGATLSTLGSMILYVDTLLKKLPCFPKHINLSTSKPFLASALSFSAGVLMVTIFTNVLPEGILGFKDSNFFGNYAGAIASIYFAICMLTITLVKYYRKVKSEIKTKPEDNESLLNPIESKVTTPRSIISRSSNSMRLENIEVKREVGTIAIIGDDGKPLESKQHKSYNLSTQLKTSSDIESQKLIENTRKIGYEIAIGIAIHNFPEGVLTFVASYQSVKRGLIFGIALALHKFPEGIMIGVPIFAGTGSKLRACLITAAASYITQLLGAGFAYAMFKIYWNPIIGGVLFLLASAILISTLFSGMLPLAKSYDIEDRYSTTWITFGIVTFVFLTSMLN